MPRAVTLITESAGDPALDTALSRTILEAVAAGESGETLRVYRPLPNVAFGRQDALTSGYGRAVQAARAAGFEAIERLAGGRAAVFHEDTVAFAWAIPEREPRHRIRERFDEVAGLVAGALRTLGVDARIGEVPGEYCPGEYSVNAGGRRKIMGVGQRLVAGAAHLGGVVVVDGATRVRDVLVPVYSAMDVRWDPTTTGSVTEEVSGVTFDEVVGAILDGVRRMVSLAPKPLDGRRLEEALTRRAEFLASPAPRPASS